MVTHMVEVAVGQVVSERRSFAAAGLAPPALRRIDAYGRSSSGWIWPIAMLITNVATGMFIGHAGQLPIEGELA